MQYPKYNQGSMPTSMETEVPDRISSSSKYNNKPQKRRASKGRRSLTPHKKNKQQYPNQKIKGNKSKLSLNSSWASKSSKSSFRTNRTTGTTYSNLSKHYKQKKQQPQLCRYWKKNKCNKHKCEFAHYEFKHLNTTYNDCMKEGAKVINENYNNNILNNMALVQITSLQFMTFQEIENKMKQTQSFKEEIEIAIINKKAYQSFKKVYQKLNKALIDDSYANKIQLKIDVFKKHYEQINIKKTQISQTNTQQAQQASQFNKSKINETSQQHRDNQLGKDMEIEQINQREKQDRQTLINNFTIQEINKPKAQKKKETDKKNTLSRLNKHQESDQQKKVDKRKSISKETKNAESNSKTNSNSSNSIKMKKQSNQTPNPIYKKIQLKTSKNFQDFTADTQDRANGMTGIIKQYHIHYLNEIAIETANNNGQLSQTAQQRLLPPLMQPNVLYSTYLVSHITNNQNEINEIAEVLKTTNEIKQKIKAKVTIDTAALYLFKTSMSYTAEENKLDAMLNNTSKLVTEKIKNIMRDQLQIDIQEATSLGIRYLLEYPIAQRGREGYYPELIFNIGTIYKENLIEVLIKDTNPKKKK